MKKQFFSTFFFIVSNVVCFGQIPCDTLPSVASVTIELVDTFCPNVVFVPSVFTPNDDGKNDYFLVLGSAVFDEFDMQIFNRWGQMIFQSKRQYEGWDGFIFNEPAAEGTYIWFISYTKNDGRRDKFSGTLSLFR